MRTSLFHRTISRSVSRRSADAEEARQWSSDTRTCLFNVLVHERGDVQVVTITISSSFWDKMPWQKGGEAVYRYRSKDTGLGAVSWRERELLLLLQVARLPVRGPTLSADPPEAGSPAKYIEDGGSEWIDLKVWINGADATEEKAVREGPAQGDH